METISSTEGVSSSPVRKVFPKRLTSGVVTNRKVMKSWWEKYGMKLTVMVLTMLGSFLTGYLGIWADLANIDVQRDQMTYQERKDEFARMDQVMGLLSEQVYQAHMRENGLRTTLDSVRLKHDRLVVRYWELERIKAQCTETN